MMIKTIGDMELFAGNLCHVTSEIPTNIKIKVEINQKEWDEITSWLSNVSRLYTWTKLVDYLTYTSQLGVSFEIHNIDYTPNNQ